MGLYRGLLFCTIGSHSAALKGNLFGGRPSAFVVRAKHPTY